MSVGLIIDAFGELRDQQEQVKEDMEVRDFGLLSSVVQVNRRQCLSVSYIFLLRPNVSSVASVMTTLTRRLTALRHTPYKSTTWPTTCEYLD